MSEPTATGTVDVPAPAEAVYGWVSDLDVLAGLSEELYAMRWTEGDGARVGARFEGDNRSPALEWTTNCTVTAADPGRRFAFAVSSRVRQDDVPVSRWEYAIEPTGEASCRVTESTWDERPEWFRTPSERATGVHDRTAANQAHIEATLARIRAYAEERAGATPTAPHGHPMSTP